MSSKGQNIGIAQPRSRPPRPNLLKTTKAGFQYPNSIINSHYQHSLFGTPSSNNRKLGIYHKQEKNKKMKLHIQIIKVFFITINLELF